jgi:hypothetical protein
LIAAFLGAEQTEPLAKDIEQSGPRIDDETMHGAVDVQVHAGVRYDVRRDCRKERNRETRGADNGCSSGKRIATG